MTPRDLLISLPSYRVWRSGSKSFTRFTGIRAPSTLSLESSRQMEQLFHIFRLDPGGKVDYVGSAQTLESSRELVLLKAFELTERFAIYNVLTHEITYLHASEVVDETSSSTRSSSSAMSPKTRTKPPK